MRNAAVIVALTLVASLLGASDVLGGAGGLVQPGKTTGPALTASVVIDLTGGSGAPGKGVTAIRVQKASTSAAVLFTSSYINSWGGGCLPVGYTDLAAGTDARFVGLMDSWVDDPGVRTALLGQFGDPSRAAITDTDHATCTTMNGRQILSFTAVIQFQP